MVAVVALAALVGCGSEPPPAAPPGPLRILLVNSNGWTAPGVVALRDALRRAGHTVVQVSPLTDRSSAGTAMTMPPAEVSLGPPTRDPELLATSGTATDATLLGLRGAMGNDPPALVIVGIDPSPNVSASALHSGTVGAAVTAAEQGVPAIAVSSDLSDLRSPSPLTPDSFGPTAQFVVRLVESLSRRPAGARLMPLHTVLNVNYPRGAPRKVVAAVTAGEPAASLVYRAGARPGSYVASTTPRALDWTDDRDDVGTLAEGNVTLSDLSADPDRTAPPPRTAKLVAPTLQP